MAPEFGVDIMNLPWYVQAEHRTSPYPVRLGPQHMRIYLRAGVFHAPASCLEIANTFEFNRSLTILPFMQAFCLHSLLRLLNLPKFLVNLGKLCHKWSQVYEILMENLFGGLSPTVRAHGWWPLIDLSPLGIRIRLTAGPFQHL